LTIDLDHIQAREMSLLWATCITFPAPKVPDDNSIGFAV
jgi:hypothetical protein